MPLDIFMPLTTFPDATPAEGLKRATDLAALLNGRLTVRLQEVDIPPIGNFVAEALLKVSELAADAERRSSQSGRALEARIRELARHHGLEVSAVHDRRRAEASIEATVAASRAHDATMMVLDPSAVGHKDLAEALLFGSGGPLVVVPAIEAVGQLERIVIAWDGGRAAARAVRDALPALRLASAVKLLAVVDDKAVDSAALDGVKDWLKFHGISCSEMLISRANEPVGDVIQRAAVAVDAGLLVMGGFGRSALREFVLGGATRTALADPRLPILMSH